MYNTILNLRLNEGFTMYFERKILGRLHDEPRRHFEFIGGWNSLEYTVVSLKQKILLNENVYQNYVKVFF